MSQRSTKRLSRARIPDESTLGRELKGVSAAWQGRVF